jgi:hypothetical protein
MANQGGVGNWNVDDTLMLRQAMIILRVSEIFPEARRSTTLKSSLVISSNLFHHKIMELGVMMRISKYISFSSLKYVFFGFFF